MRRLRRAAYQCSCSGIANHCRMLTVIKVNNRGSFTHFICLLPIDRVSQRLSCQLYALYPSLACTEFSVTFQRLSHSPCALSSAFHCIARLCFTLQRSMELAQEKGASTWLTALPIEEHGFALHKAAFKDSLSLRYGWPLQNSPSHCSCGQPFSVEHALNCKTGGFPTVRHNKVRDITATLLTEVCHGVTIEPYLQPLSGESLAHRSAITEDGARFKHSRICTLPVSYIADTPWSGCYPLGYRFGRSNSN